MVDLKNVLKGAKWFFIILFIDVLVYPMALPIIRQIEGTGALIYQSALFVILAIITLAIPTLVAITEDEQA